MFEFHTLKDGQLVLIDPEPKIAHVKPRRILITGNPRSGSHTYAHCMSEIGVDAPHERLGKDGTVSCFFFFPATYMPLSENTLHYDRLRFGDEQAMPEMYQDYDFEDVFHLVRHPLKCIRSMVKLMGTPHQKWCIYHHLAPLCYNEPKGKSKLKRIMHTWYNTNQLIEEQATARIRIEDGMKGLRKVCRVLGVKPPAWDELPIVNPVVINKGKAPPYTWEELEEADSAMAKKIYRMAKRYGYEK